MANEFQHKSIGAELTQSEFEAVGGHILDSQAIGDLIYATSAIQLSRLGIGATDTVLVTIGGVPSWAATLAGLTLTSPVFNTGVSGTAISTDTALGTSNTLLSSQGAIKSYVDALATASDLDFQGDSGGALSIDLDSETLVIAGGTGIDTVGGTNTLTVNIDSTVATLIGTQTLTNKTLTAPVMTAPVLGTPASGVLTNATGYPGDSSLVTVGELTTGSIASGFGTINNGANSITTTGTLGAGASTLGATTGTTIDGIIGSVTPAAGTFTTLGTTGLLTAASLTVTGTTTLNGDLVLGDAALDTLTISATIQGATPLVFEGATAGLYETSFFITDPSADRTITFPDATLTVNAAANISGTTLASNVVTSSLTTVGALGSGSIGTGFGVINNAAAITGTVITASTNFAGALTGDVTGNVSGTAATVTGATQSNITAVGTLGSIDIDGGAIDGTVIGANSAAAGTFAALVSTTFAPSDDITLAADKVINLGEAGKIDFGDEAPADNAATGIVFSFLAGATLAIGDVVYMGTDGEVLKADANQATTMPAIGICVGAGTDGNAVDVLVQGIMHDTSAFDTFTVGADVFVSAAATGAIVAAAPSGSGDTVQKVGVALHADMVYFNFNTTEVLLA